MTEILALQALPEIEPLERTPLGLAGSCYGATCDVTCTSSCKATCGGWSRNSTTY